jgi:tetratricopeptide (TPR) repeat protein
MGWQLLRALAAGALVVWLVAMTGTLRVRSFNRAASECEASNHFRIAETFAMQGQTGQAITHFTEGLRLKPDSADALNIMAWIRSASPQTEFRDGPEAVRLAERACQLTDYKVPLYVGTLATALDHLAWIRSASPRAELRDGPEAVRLAERACQLTDYKVPLHVGTLATALNNLARMRAASSQADLSEAVRLAERACQLTGYQVPLHVQTLAGVLNNLAFLRAASPQAELRDGPEAVRLAERACQLTDYQVPKLVGTLAAAYAEAGRFDEAVTTAVRERELAMARGESGLAERTLKIIELYKARQPVRDGDLRDEPRRVVPRP